MALPAVPYPATIEVHKTVDDKASVAFRGNRYSVPPGMGGAELTLRHRLGTGSLEVYSPSGVELVSHALARPGAGQTVRTEAHRAALEAVVLSQFSTSRPCDRKANKPPGEAALAERARLLQDQATSVGRRAERRSGRHGRDHRPGVPRSGRSRGGAGMSEHSRYQSSEPTWPFCGYGGRRSTAGRARPCEGRRPQPPGLLGATAVGRSGRGRRTAPGQSGPVRLPALTVHPGRLRLLGPAVGGQEDDR